MNPHDRQARATVIRLALFQIHGHCRPSVLKTFSPSFLAGARAGLNAFLPLSIGWIPWAVVTGVAMIGAGFTPIQAMGMNIVVYAGTAQLGVLPLIGLGAPVWLIVATTLALNLRFVIFSASIARGFRGQQASTCWLCSYLLTNGVFAICDDKVLDNDDADWRLGYYLAPSLWGWLVWQCFTLLGIVAADLIPRDWSLEFMATIALTLLLWPLTQLRPMLIAAVIAGCVSVVLNDIPLRLGLIMAIVAGIVAGLLAERRFPGAAA